MVSNYKEMMNGKREIPISSCSPQIEDLVYGTGSVLHPQEDAGNVAESFDIDERPSASKKAGKRMNPEREQKLKQVKKTCGYNSVFTYCQVDTENCFRYNGQEYEIDESVIDYAPKKTHLGLLYDMDKIICVKSEDGQVRYYTARYDPVDSELVKKKL